MDSSAKLHGRAQEVGEGREQNMVLGAADERAPAKRKKFVDPPGSYPDRATCSQLFSTCLICFSRLTMATNHISYSATSNSAHLSGLLHNGSGHSSSAVQRTKVLLIGLRRYVLSDGLLILIW